jgi:paraquat-inducible protein B
VRLDSEGFRVNFDSLESLIGGGVTFGVPEDLPPGSRVEPDATFSLYPDEDSARQGTFNRYLEYVMLVDDTVRGLGRGAPVEFRGVRIGTVAAVPWNFIASQPDSRERFAIPVLIRIEPQRLGIERSELDLEDWQGRFRRFFDLGLRASLKNGNLLTGAMFVDLNFQRDLAGEYVEERFAERTVFPTTSGGFAQIESQVTDLLAKLNGLEIEPLLDGLDRNLSASEAMLTEVRELTDSVSTLLDDPGTRELPSNLNTTLAELSTTLQGISPQSRAYREFSTTLQQLERLLRDLQPTARTLRDNPRALLFDSIDGQDPLPRAPGSTTQGASQ